VTGVVRFTRQSGGALLVSTLVLLSGCAWIPKGDPPAAYLEPPEMKETLAEVTSRLEQWPDDRWWEQFNNPELNQLMEAALNPEVAGASILLGVINPLSLRYEFCPPQSDPVRMGWGLKPDRRLLGASPSI
jgi:hypothetical protein